jgi:hypothetical protein
VAASNPTPLSLTVIDSCFSSSATPSSTSDARP